MSKEYNGGYINNHVILYRTQRTEDEKPHSCKLPGWWSRHWWSMKEGAQVGCRKCGARYEWQRHYRSARAVFAGLSPSYMAWTRL